MSGLMQNEKGQTSAMRVMAVPAVCAGIATVLASVVGMFLRIPDAVLMAYAGIALAGLSFGGKAIQARAEHGPGG
jgi:hypothetical protein